MRLATFTDRDGTRVGVVDGEALIDLARAAPDLPRSLAGILDLGAPALEAARAARGPGPSLADVRLEAPVPRPGKYLAVGLNYLDHIAELGYERPTFPSCFVKLNTAITGPYDPVYRPLASDSLDYEGELGMVIARRCRRVPRDRAAEVIAGYVVCNDLTVREWVAKAPQVTLAKSFDSCAPFGPWLVTADEVGDPHALGLRTTVNGEVRQDSRTSEMLFDCYDLIEAISAACTLEPGDVITTGTPPGVGHGMTPPRTLAAGDVVRVEIERIGAIENRIIDEPADALAGEEGGAP